MRLRPTETFINKLSFLNSMVWLFRKRGEENNQLSTTFSHFHNSVSLAFDLIKRDFAHITNWIHYFHSKHQEHDLRLSKIEEQLQLVPKSHAEIKQIIDYYYSYESILKRMEEICKRVEYLEKQKNTSTELPERIERKVALKEKLVRQISQGSKDYVKTVILSTITKYGQIAGQQLREMIVNEQGLCSKSSFYRLLGELEQDGLIAVTPSGKEKIYAAKQLIMK